MFAYFIHLGILRISSKNSLCYRVFYMALIYVLHIVFIKLCGHLKYYSYNSKYAHYTEVDCLTRSPDILSAKLLRYTFFQYYIRSFDAFD